MEHTVAGWNVNGLKSRKGRVQELLKLVNAEVVVLIEIKCKDPRAVLPDLDYSIYSDVGDKSGRHGVAMLVRGEALRVWNSRKLLMDGSAERSRIMELAGLREEDIDAEAHTMCAKEGRMVAAELHDCVVVGVYVPNSGTKGLRRLGLRTAVWDPLFRGACQYLAATVGKPLIILGDMNVVPRPCDIWYGAKGRWREVRNKRAGCCDGEQDGFAALKEACGLVDLLELPEEEAEKGYTFWSSWRGGTDAHTKNQGWRLDTILTNAYPATGKVLRDFVTGDHAPITASIWVGEEEGGSGGKSSDLD